jgi:tRNA uridine 5-carboxymethylaminomethyl modification enzyme
MGPAERSGLGRGVEEIRELLRRRTVQESDCAKLPHLRKHLGRSLEQALKDPEVHIAQLFSGDAGADKFEQSNPAWLRLSELDVKYEGYIKRQERQVERFRKMEDLKIPPDFDYEAATGLSTESRLKFEQIRPLSIGQASRISGVRSSDIAVLLVHLAGRRRESG